MSRVSSYPALPLKHFFAITGAFLYLLVLSGCTTVVIDEYRETHSQLDSDRAVVVLGRRHSSDYETEPELIQCIGEVLTTGGSDIRVIPEREFLDSLYPWFEPRTAPMNMRRLNRLVERTDVANAIADYNIDYIVWVDGNTETTDSSGSIGCSIGTGGAGCFGFGTWDKESDYEASIWDYQQRRLSGKISAGATGTSYMPAVVVPIPLIARVQANACKGMGLQLRSFFRPEEGGHRATLTAFGGLSR